MTTEKFKLYDSVSAISSIAPNLWQVKNCFEVATLDRLRNIAQDAKERFFPSYQANRFELTEDSVSRTWLNEMGLVLAGPIGKITGEKLNLMSVKYWVDLPFFCCPPHYDHADILVTYQIYLVSVPDPYHPIHGTHFMHVDPTVPLPFESNCGYINYNQDLKLHRVDPGNGSRTSITFQFTRQ